MAEALQVAGLIVGCVALAVLVGPGLAVLGAGVSLFAVGYALERGRQ